MSTQTPCVHELQSQIIELQTKQAYQEESLWALEKTVAQQHQELNLLNKKLELLSEFIKTLPLENTIKRAEEESPPPHY